MFHSFFGEQEAQEFLVWTFAGCQTTNVLESALKTLGLANIESFRPSPQNRRPSILINKGIVMRMENGGQEDTQE